MRTDTLIENQEWFRKSNVSVKRNTAEMMVHCLLESPYYSEELHKALSGHSKVIMEGEPWKSHMTGDYTAYVLMMFGSYLNWEGYDVRNLSPSRDNSQQSAWRHSSPVLG